MAHLRRKSVASSNQKMRNPIAKAVSRAKHSSFYHDLSLRGKHPLRLLGTPKDLWPGSVTVGTQMVGGKIIGAGSILENPNNAQNIWPEDEVWIKTDFSDKWLEHLHSFSWLKDLNQAVDRTNAKKRAEELVETWIDHNTQWGEISWRADVVGSRVINWLVYAPLIMDTEDIIYRSRVLDILARSARHLMKMSSDLPVGPGSLKAIAGLILSGLYIPNGDDWLKKGVALLRATLPKEILDDGGLRSRNPHELLELLMTLVLVRDAFIGMAQNAPQELSDSIDRMAVNLSSIILGDGKLPLFNGSYIQNHEDVFSSLIKITNDTSSFDKRVVNDLEQSGFSRIENQNTIIIQDVGPPAELELSGSCHAGALSFEMSSGTQRIFVNRGNASFAQGVLDEDISTVSRSTSAHTTLTLNDSNSSEIRTDGLVGKGISETTSVRFIENGHILLESSHDGYLDRYGLLHKRLIYMNDLGDDIRGEDILEQTGSDAKNVSRPYSVRFHLHPNVSAALSAGGDVVLLELTNGERWKFRFGGAKVTIEDSLYFGDAGKASQCRQINLTGDTDGPLTTILWALELQKKDD